MPVENGADNCALIGIAVLPLQERRLPVFQNERRIAGRENEGAHNSQYAPTIEKDFYRFRFGLPADAPHETALDSQVVLTRSTKVRVQIIDLDRSQGNVLRQSNICPAASSHGKRVA